MKLPPSLTPWAQQLKMFPDEISLALGTMAQKLSPFVAPMRSEEEVSNREPNGYDGVARRGIYERLLLSELALADEISEEFVRRAVMGEHLFLNLARVAPAAKRKSIALFSAGAEQLGSPRIAHLAALVILARRAAAVKAFFEWGVLQDGELKIFSELNESNIRHLLNSRTIETLSAKHITSWREKLQEMNKPADVWLIGSPDLKEMEEAKGFSLFMVEDVLAPNARQLEISVKSASGILRETTLDLPSDSISTRLLRNPFEVYNLPDKINLTTKLSSFFFDDNGGKLFARSAADENAVLYFAVPNSPNASSGSPRQYRLFHQNDLLLGAGRLGKSIATIALTEDGHLRLDYPKIGNFKLKQGKYKIENGDFVLPKDSKTLLPVYNLHFSKSSFYQAAILDANNNLFILNKGDDLGNDLVGHAFLAATDVLVAARTEHRFIFVGRESISKIFQIVSYGEQTERRDLPVDDSTQGVFGRGGGIANPVFGLLALGNQEKNFAIIKNGAETFIEASPESEVVGVFYDPGFSAEVGLVELEEDRRTVNFNVGRKYHKQIFVADDQIEKIVFSHRSPLCAYQTVLGQTIVYSITHRTPIATFGTVK